ncbi:antitoxin [Serinicoccus sp. CNJ-927]|uniref:antitoxin n=1 Tax=Serinicoccus sp. CNJ-927 TaxID=1904970 RepID=UPI0009FAEB83
MPRQQRTQHAVAQDRHPGRRRRRGPPLRPQGPEKTRSFLDKAADFADRQTKGKYTSQIRSVCDTAGQAALGDEGRPRPRDEDRPEGSRP